MHYKELAAQPVWLPPKDADARPLVTLEDGIEIFKANTPPPDPLQEPPAEVELHAGKRKRGW